MNNSRHAGRSSYKPHVVRKRRRRLIRRLVCLAVVVAVIALLSWLITVKVREHREEQHIKSVVEEHQATFQPGVTINGNELTGYTLEEAYDALNEKYAATIHQEVTLVFGERTWSFVPEQVGAQIDLASQVDKAWAYGKSGDMLERYDEIMTLKEEPVELSAELTYDEAALEAFVLSIKQEIDCQPVNAYRRIVDNEKFEFSDSSVGYSLDADALIAQLQQVILTGGVERIEIEPEILQPSPSRKELEEATVLLAECTTSLETSSSSRTHNVNLALGYFNYLEVAPGEKVSFNKVVGQRTEENGFSKAPEYAGTTIITGIGGGVCQASTTVYGAVIRAGLEILERHPHNMTVSYVQASQDASVNNDDKDMRFKNNTDSTLIFFAWVDAVKKEATVKIYGKPVDSNVRIEIVSEVLQTDIRGGDITYEPDTDGDRVWYVDDTPVLLSQGKPGMHSKAYRVYQDLITGELIKREELSEDIYEPQNDIYLIGVHTRN